MDITKKINKMLEEIDAYVKQIHRFAFIVKIQVAIEVLLSILFLMWNVLYHSSMAYMTLIIADIIYMAFFVVAYIKQRRLSSLLQSSCTV